MMMQFLPELFITFKQSFLYHDVKHMLVGFVHGILTDTCEIMDAIIHIIINYTFDGGDTLVLNGKHGRKDGC